MVLKSRKLSGTCQRHRSTNDRTNTHTHTHATTTIIITPYISDMIEISFVGVGSGRMMHQVDITSEDNGASEMNATLAKLQCMYVPAEYFPSTQDATLLEAEINQVHLEQDNTIRTRSRHRRTEKI